MEITETNKGKIIAKKGESLKTLAKNDDGMEIWDAGNNIIVLSLPPITIGMPTTDLIKLKKMFDEMDIKKLIGE